MPLRHPTDPDAPVCEEGHELLQEAWITATHLARSLTAATGEPWTADDYDPNDARLGEPLLIAHLIATHGVVRERNGFRCKVLHMRGRTAVRLAFDLVGQDYDDAFEGTWHIRPRPLGPIDIVLTAAQLDGNPADPLMVQFLRHADAVWGRVLQRRAEREAVPE